MPAPFATISDRPSALRRLADKLAVESEPGLTTAQLMVRNLATDVARVCNRQLTAALPVDEP